MHGGAVFLFTRFWWLIFPLFWMISRIFRLSLEHNRAQQTLDVIKAYADQGKEVPPELVKALQQPTPYSDGLFDRPRDRARGLMIPGFIFVALALAFCVLIIGRVEGPDPEDFYGMLFVVVLFLGFAAAFLTTAFLYNRDSRRQDPPH